METTSKSVMKSALALGTGTALNIIISLITTPIITRIVTPDAYGEWSIFTMYTNIALMILVLGLDQALIRFFYDNENIVYRRNLLKISYFITINILKLKTQNTIIRTNSNFNCCKRVIIIR